MREGGYYHYPITSYKRLFYIAKSIKASYACDVQAYTAHQILLNHLMLSTHQLRFCLKESFSLLMHTCLLQTQMMPSRKSARVELEGPQAS